VRPVNLIPPEDRRGDRTQLRRGSLSYALIAILVLALIGTYAVVTTNSKISERQAEVTSLQAREEAARARAAALGPYAEFATMAQARDATVSSLAQSRFDWERVLRELALVIPDNVWLVSTTGTVSPEVQLENAGGVALRSQVSGPALEIIGCGDGQEAVAAFVAALKDIDGVTRVGLNSSARNIEAGADGGGGGGGTDCRTRGFIAQFEIVVAFDAVPAPAAAATTPAPGGTPAVNPVPQAG
jgi:Tfp pilus assembly protein PilN